MSDKTTKVEVLTRWPEEVSDALDNISRVEGKTLSDLILEGVMRVIQARKGDSEFNNRPSDYPNTMLGE